MERIGYLRKLLIETGVDPGVAGARARIMNWCYLGYVLSANELNDASLKLVIRDLTQLARLKVQEFPLRTRAPDWRLRDRRAGGPGHERLLRGHASARTGGR